MSSLSQKPTPEAAMNSAAPENRFAHGLGTGGSAPGPNPEARLQAIHDLIRSGDYHVPATAIADRMIERMIADRRRRKY